MSYTIATGKHLSLQGWKPKGSTEKDPVLWEFAQRVNKTNKKNPKRDDSIVVAPVFYKKGEAQVGLTLCERPALEDKPSKGLHWEVVGGLNKDSAAIRSTPANAKKELREETNFEFKKLLKQKVFPGLASSGGMTDETHSIMTSVNEASKSGHMLKKPDPVALKLVSVPLKQAFTFLKEQANLGFNVALTSIAAIFNAIHDLKVQPDFETKNIQATPIWDIATQSNLTKTKIQEIGLKRLEELKTGLLQNVWIK